MNGKLWSSRNAAGQTILFVQAEGINAPVVQFAVDALDLDKVPYQHESVPIRLYVNPVACKAADALQLKGL